MAFGTNLIAAIREARSSHVKLDLSDKAVLLKNLVLLFHMMRASEHLLRSAWEKCSTFDPLYMYFLEHLKEEVGHEKWLRDDLLTAGVDVQSTTIPRIVVEMVGTQYYLIHHVDQAALLGYMAVLECMPTSLDDIAKLEDLHGTDLLRTCRYHAQHDVEHGQFLEQVLNALPVERQAIVWQNAQQTCEYFGRALRD